MITLYGIPHCDTVKKARAWLHTQGVAHEFHDFKKHGVPSAALAAWVQSLGWEKLLNRQGTTWRKLDPATQALAVDADHVCHLLQTHPSLIKRPVVDWGDGHSVGFQPETWAHRLAKAT